MKQKDDPAIKRVRETRRTISEQFEHDPEKLDFGHFSVHHYAQTRTRSEIGACRGFTMICANYLRYACLCGGEYLGMAKVEEKVIAYYIELQKKYHHRLMSETEKKEPEDSLARAA